MHNTPIEGLWHWFLQNNGVNIKDAIRQGYNDGIYNPNNVVHPCVLKSFIRRYLLIYFTLQEAILLALVQDPPDPARQFCGVLEQPQDSNSEGEAEYVWMHAKACFCSSRASCAGL